MAALQKLSVPQPAPSGAALAAPAAAVPPTKEQYLKAEEKFLLEDKEAKKKIEDEIAGLSKTAPEWKGDFLFRAEMTKPVDVQKFCARSVPAALEKDKEEYKKAAEKALHALHDKDDENLLQVAYALAGKLYDLVRAKIQTQTTDFMVKDMTRVKIKSSIGLALSEKEKETKERKDELDSNKPDVVRRTADALVSFVKKSAEGQIEKAIKDKYESVFDLLEDSHVHEARLLRKYLGSPVRSSAEFAPASHPMDFEAQQNAWSGAPPSSPPPLEEKRAKPEPFSPALAEVKNGGWASPPASPLYAAPAAAAKPGGEEAQWGEAEDALAERFHKSACIDDMPICDVPLTPGAETNGMRYMFKSGNCNLARVGQLLAKATEPAQRIHGIEVTHVPGSGVSSRVSTCVLPVSLDEVRRASSNGTVKTVLCALQVCLYKELLAARVTDRLPMLGTPTVACNADAFKFWEGFIEKQPEGKLPLGVHSRYARITAPDGSDIGPVPLVPIPGDKKDKRTGLPLLAAVFKHEYDESTMREAKFKITVEEGHITISHNSATGRVTLKDVTPISSSHWKIPMTPGATKAEVWRYMGQTGVGKIPCPAASRPTFGLSVKAEVGGGQIRNTSYYMHPTCLVMEAREVKFGAKGTKAKPKTRYVFLTAMKTLVIIDPDESAGEVAMEAMKAGTEATEKCRWPTPGKSSHAMSEVREWLKEMQTPQYKHLVTRELRDAAMLAWANVDVYQMLMGTPCPMATFYDVKEREQMCFPGTAAAIYYYISCVHPIGLSEYLIPLLFEMFTVAFEKHGLRPP